MNSRIGYGAHDMQRVLNACDRKWRPLTEIGQRCGIDYRNIARYMPTLVGMRCIEWKFRGKSTYQGCLYRRINEDQRDATKEDSQTEVQG